MGSDLAGHARAASLCVPDRADGLPGAHVRDVERAARQLRERDPALLAGFPGDPREGLVRRVARKLRGVLADQRDLLVVVLAVRGRDHDRIGDQVVDPRIAFMISSILSDNVARTPAMGADSALKLDFPAAVKTVSIWFPKKERALATGLFNAGSNVGNHPGIKPEPIECHGRPYSIILNYPPLSSIVLKPRRPIKSETKLQLPEA